jgi:predicted flap endonuclease-1-like 5' DNA nuclease
VLYAKMLPYDKAAGRICHDHSVMNPDTGNWDNFKAGDTEWSKVSDEYGEMLRKTRQHFFRPNSPPLFLVVTEEEADRIDKEEELKRRTAGRKARPRRSLARDLTKGTDGLSPLERMSDAPEEPEVDLADIDRLQNIVAEQDEKLDKLTSLVAQLTAQLGQQSAMPSVLAPISGQMSAPIPEEPAPPSPVSEEWPEPESLPVESTSRAAALGLDMPPIDAPAESQHSLTDLRGVGGETLGALTRAGVASLEDLVSVDADTISEMADARGVTPRKIRGWQEQAKELLKR